jgi:hypothetical protein
MAHVYESRNVMRLGDFAIETPALATIAPCVSQGDPLGARLEIV